MLKKEAKKITGGLSKPSKMPGPAFNLPASRCITGAKLVKVPGSVCHGCYALKGRYRFENVQKALEGRRQALSSPHWVEAMTVLVQGHEFFRWHDSGDLQSLEHLKKIFEVCKRTPSTKHWLPTREAQILKQVQPEDVPENLIIRFSSHMIDQGPVSFWPHTSTVVTKNKTCPAAEQDNACGSCRACWNKEVKNIAYGKH
jgi:hypothetical protein